MQKHRNYTITIAAVAIIGVAMWAVAFVPVYGLWLQLVLLVVLIALLIRIYRLREREIAATANILSTYHILNAGFTKLDDHVLVLDKRCKQLFSNRDQGEQNNLVTDGCFFKLSQGEEACVNCTVANYNEDTFEEFRELSVEDRWYESVNRRFFVGDKPYILSRLRDISVQKELINKLVLSELDFKQIIEGFPVAVVITNDNYEVVLANTATTKLFDTDAENILGQNVTEKFRLRKLSEHNSFTKISDLEKYAYLNKYGEELTLYKKEVPIVLQDVDGFLQTFIDITPIEQARKGEEEANRAKSDFLANMSHEIRTPMNAVVGMADMFMTSAVTKADKEYASIIKKSADQLLSIINDILDFSKIEAGRMHLEEIPFLLREEVGYVAEAFRHKAKEKGIELITKYEKGLQDKIIGDPFRLRQIVTNMVSNAIKFTDQGRVEIHVEEIKESYDTVTLLFSIIDTGIGIPEDKQACIFESFSQADSSTTRKYGGTGLGTTISKELVELMDGEIWVESPGGISDDEDYPGSKFCFTAEFIADKQAEKEINAAGIALPIELNVVVVDKEGNKNILADSLASVGFPVQMMHSASALVDFLKKKFMHAEMPKIIFIEHSKVFDGFAVLKEIEELDICQHYIIVMLSSLDKTGNYARAKRLMADYYLIKPFEAAEVEDIIKTNFPDFSIQTEAAFETETLRKDLAILVAEDNIMNQRVAQIIFKSIGYEIDIAENGNQVIEKIAEKKYDIIFMDFIMPHKDGMQTTIELREMGVTVPIIAMTGKATDEDEKMAYSTGMDDFLTKPITINAIKSSLSKWFLERKETLLTLSE